ncbi:MAG: hypothetical protein DMD83_26585 [Candidatus Rokuibacteriota bacterium]|nr:MAG: hypothetical protein DMD83_26585 [Candidatus Rokubacteria bacterium]
MTVTTAAVTLGSGRLTIADVVAVARDGVSVLLHPDAATRLAKGAARWRNWPAATRRSTA